MLRQANGNNILTCDEKRRHTMSQIKSKDTSIEVSLRKALWQAGIRYRKNYSKLPGTPDIAITKHRIAVFCDGEFWHGKDWEKKKSSIKSNREYWIKKIERNIYRDNETRAKLQNCEWTVVRFWGSEIRDDVEGCVEEIKDIIFQGEIDAFCAKSDVDGLKPDEYPCGENEGVL